MQDLVSNLVHRVATTLPWDVRVANLFHNLRISGTSIPDVYGQTAMGVFYLIGVQGMPPLENPPKNVRQIDNRHIPPIYGRLLGRKAMGWAMKRLKDKEKAEEFLLMHAGEWSRKAVHGQLNALEGKDLDSASKYLFKAMSNFLMDQHRTDTRQEVSSPSDVDFSDLGDSFSGGISEITPLQISDVATAAAQQIARQNPNSGITKDDVMTYIELLSNGLSNDKIINDKMLPFLKERETFSPSAWTKYKDIIVDTMTKELTASSIVVRRLDMEPVIASDLTMEITANLVEKTASSKTGSRLSYMTQIEFMQSEFTNAAAIGLYEHVLSLHKQLESHPKFENVSFFTSWDYGSPRQNGNTWSSRVWIKSVSVIPVGGGDELEPNLEIRITFGDSVDVELVMGNRKTIFKKNFSAASAYSGVIGAYCADEWSKLLKQ